MNIQKKIRGMGLIEVLITTVVVATGLLSVATMQGEFLSTSSENKIKEEAKNLCHSKVEQLRDSIEDPKNADGTDNTTSSYYQISSSDSDESITGVNETYTRSWVVTDLTDPDRKQITATCSWPDGSVISQAIISFQDISISLQVAANTLGGGSSDDGAGLPVAAPSTNANSSDEINDPVDVLKSNIDLSDTDKYSEGAMIIDTSDGKGSVVYDCSTLTAFDTDYISHVFARRIYYKGSVDTFQEAIELFEGDSDDTYCTRKIRFNGGVAIPMRGIVYSRAKDGTGNNTPTMTVNKFAFNTTESGTFCVFNPGTDDVKAPYSCYVGGNCISGTSGEYSDSNLMLCPTPPTHDGAGIYPDNTYDYIGAGGWRGKIGLKGIITEDKNVCFAEEIANDGSNLSKDTARNYYARRGSGSTAENEGINQGYECHHFLIVEQRETLSQVANECSSSAEDTTADDGAGSLVGVITTKTIERLVSSDNIYNPSIDSSACPGLPTFNVTASKGTATCNSSACSALNAGTYTIEVSTDGVTCSGDFTISSDTEIDVSTSKTQDTVTSCSLSL